MSVLGAAALMGGASLLGGLMNANSAKQINQTAQQQFERNMAFQKWQYNDMKRYNSPSNQVRMLRRAGLNPAMALANGFSPTPISDVGGVSSTASMSPVDYSGIMSSAASLGNSLIGAKLEESQTAKNLADSHKAEIESAGMQIDNLYKDEFWKSSNYARNSLSYLQDIQSDIAKLDLQYQRQSLGDRLFEQRWNSEYKRALAEAQLITNTYVPVQLQAQINDLVASAKQRVLMGTASVKQAVASIMQATSTKNAFDAQYGGDPSQRGAFFNAILRAMDDAHELVPSQKFGNYTSGISALVGNAIGGWRTKVFQNIEKAKL